MLLISQDYKYFFTTDDSVINVFNLNSGEIVFKLSHSDSLSSELSTKEASIASICLNPFNKYQLLSFHENSTICLWDYEDGLLMQTFDCGELNIIKILNINSSIYAVGHLKNSSHSGPSFYRLLLDSSTLKSNKTIEHQLIVSNLSLNLDKLQISIDKNQNYITYIEGRKKLVISHFKNSVYTLKYKSKIELTCLALHPNEDCIATGTTSGKIILWYNYLKGEMRNSADNTPEPTECVLHWHSLPVLCVYFSTEGSILLSGGHECVLVKWLFKSGQKDFKPRMGSPITSILASSDNSVYISKHLDNTIHLLAANMKVVQTISTFLCPHFQTMNKEMLKNSNYSLYPTGLNYFNRLSCLVTNGKPGHLQFYSTNSDKLLFNLDIVNENYISPENLNRPNVHTEIECLAFSSDSAWLATVERRDDSVTTPESRLKFWFHDSTNNKFNLNTLVRHPHSYDRVNKIKFKPNENILLSCGQDGCFKSWTLVKSSQTAKSNWVYSTSNGYRDTNPNNVEFLTINSSDYLAVSFNYIVTLWKFESDNCFSFVDDLIHCHLGENVKWLQKLSHSNLIVVHEQNLNIWNLEESSSDDLLVDSTETTFSSSCVLSEPVDDVLYVKLINESQVAIISRKLDNLDNSKAKIKISLIEKKRNIFDVKNIHEFVLNTNGFLNFVIIPNTEKNLADLECMNIFYADNFGVVKKLMKNNWSKNSHSDELSWDNRKKMTKNQVESNLARIIAQKNSHMMINADLVDNLLADQKNDYFDTSLKKIENTPAFLMPQIGDFCLNLLKSMLIKQNEN